MQGESGAGTAPFCAAAAGWGCVLRRRRSAMEREAASRTGERKRIGSVDWSTGLWFGAVGEMGLGVWVRNRKG